MQDIIVMAERDRRNEDHLAIKNLPDNTRQNYNG